MRICFLSDLHVSRYGDTNEAHFSPFLKIGGQVVDIGILWSTHETFEGWKIQENIVSGHWRVLDPDGIRRPTFLTGLDALKKQAEVWCAADAINLVSSPPSNDERMRLLEIDPSNTNLMLFQIRAALDSLDPPADWLVLSGDITDNGYGYFLVNKALQPWFEASRVFVVPGNHDLNRIIPYYFGMEPGTTTREEKEQRFWSWYKDNMRLPPFSMGCSSSVNAGDGVYLIGLDSVKNVSRSFGIEPMLNAIGEVSQAAIQRLKNTVYETRKKSADCCIIVVLHHHVPWQGFADQEAFEQYININNAEELWETLVDLRVNVVANGHRHYSYYRDDIGPGKPALLSSPSSTLGDSRDRSVGCFMWLMDINSGDKTIVSRQAICAA